MKARIDSTERNEGKSKVCISFEDSPNALGEFYPDKVFNKLKTAVEIHELLLNPLCTKENSES